MAIIYARLIELVAVLLIGLSIYGISEIKQRMKFKKHEKEWLENSFEWNGGRYSKKFFDVINGEVVYNGDKKSI